MLALAASTLTAYAQSPADTLQDVRPFSPHALDLLMAREPGVEVISSPGAPGTTPTIHIRGLGVLPGIEPVYVVDGMRRRNLDGIAPESIEKIEVLKNAAAMGQWGPEAAAGVVVVTTRRASQQGFHAGYEFAGGFQNLAHAPEKMTLAEYREHNWYSSPDYRESEQPTPETTFMQKHHLYAQYGGNKLSAYAGFSMLDNDGPYPDKIDTYRRYAAFGSAEYRPLRWLSLETTGRWNQSSTSRAPQLWLSNYLFSAPTYGDDYASYLKSDQDKLSEAAIQGRISIYPLPGLYVRGIGGYSQGMKHLRKAVWTDYINEDPESPYTQDYVEARTGHEGKKWFQWGIEAGWKGQWRGHSLRLDGTFRRIKEKQDNQVLQARGNLSDIGVKYGDDAVLEDKFIPYFEKYMNADWEERFEMLSLPTYASPYRVGTPELKWKEGVLSVGYDWKSRYEANFSYFRCWEEKLFSGEGWRVPAVTLGWTLSEEPILRRVLPTSLKNWSIKASWSKADNYTPLFDGLIQIIPGLSNVYYSELASAASRHRDLTTSLSFQFGGPALDLSASWYVNDDDLNGAYSYSLRNQGVELAGTLRQNVGSVRYSLSAFMTFYGNRVRFGESLLKGYESFPWQSGSGLGIKDGEPIGGHLVAQLIQENPPRYSSMEDRVWKGSAFPKVTGGIHASIGWNRWQLTVSGHGDRGQTIQLGNEGGGALFRYYLEDNPTTKQLLENEHLYYYDLRDLDFGILDASFFRIDQLRLDYTLPLKNVRLNLFASLENWFLFTKYPGTDPEQALAWNVMELNTGNVTYTPRLTGSYIGVETANYPSTRRTIFGLSISF